MKNLLLLFCFILSSYAIEEPSTLINGTGKIRRVDDVRYAGQADGKHFYLGLQSSIMNWSQASEKCRQADLQYAEIVTPAQAEVITSFYEDGGLGAVGPYWVGGREFQDLRRFAWVSNNEDASGSNATLSPLPAVNLCLLFTPNKGEFESRSCTTVYSRGWICEVAAECRGHHA